MEATTARAASDVRQNPIAHGGSRAAEAQARFPKMKIVGLRYFNVFGPRENYKGKAASMIWQLAGQMLAGRNPRLLKHTRPDGSRTRWG